MQSRSRLSQCSAGTLCNPCDLKRHSGDRLYRPADAAALRHDRHGVLQAPCPPEMADEGAQPCRPLASHPTPCLPSRAPPCRQPRVTDDGLAPESCGVAWCVCVVSFCFVRPGRAVRRGRERVWCSFRPASFRARPQAAFAARGGGLTRHFGAPGVCVSVARAHALQTIPQVYPATMFTTAPTDVLIPLLAADSTTL